MKTFSMSLILVMASCILSGCSTVDNQDELLEANKALVLRAHEEVWSKGDLDLIDELYSPDYVAHWAYGEDTDREGIREMITEARTAFPDMTEDVVHIVAEGDLVVTHFISSGTFTGEMKGLEPSGKKISRPEIAIHRIIDGKIVEQWTVSDQMTLMRQLGLM
jgi:steroid delta-isomerase-like uncharacterized protein